MKNCPDIYSLEWLVKGNSCQAEINGKWVPARPVGLMGLNLLERFKVAWEVFVGNADAVVWPEGQ